MPLFSQIREPYAELVEAVLTTIPTVMREDIGQDLVRLTRSCLVKTPEERLRLVLRASLRDVASAPTQTPIATVDLSSRMREASDRYSQEIEAKREEGSRVGQLIGLRCASFVDFSQTVHEHLSDNLASIAHHAEPSARALIRATPDHAQNCWKKSQIV